MATERRAIYSCSLRLENPVYLRIKTFSYNRRYVSNGPHDTKDGRVGSVGKNHSTNTCGGQKPVQELEAVRVLASWACRVATSAADRSEIYAEPS